MLLFNFPGYFSSSAVSSVTNHLVQLAKNSSFNSGLIMLTNVARIFSFLVSSTSFAVFVKAKYYASFLIDNLILTYIYKYCLYPRSLEQMIPELNTSPKRYR